MHFHERLLVLDSLHIHVPYTDTQCMKGVLVYEAHYVSMLVNNKKIFSWHLVCFTL